MVQQCSHWAFLGGAAPLGLHQHHSDCTSTTWIALASFPGLHAQLLLLAVQKAGGRPERIYHVMSAAAHIT